MPLLKSFVRAHTTKGFFEVIRQANSEWRIYRLHCRGLKKLRPLLQRSEKKLNLGCGPNCKSGWINIDLFDSRADVQLDLRERWPFDDAAVSYIYSEHAFEHFEPHEEAAHLLTEAQRVLRPGGAFDVGVPDTEWPLRAYANPSDPYWTFAKTVHPSWCVTQLDHLNYHFRQRTEHKYAWDYETLARKLNEFGFTDIARREYDPALDSESRKIGTLYVIARKPLHDVPEPDTSAEMNGELAAR
ncbi:MAG: methyltransferase domain-containing protein [Candidatus Sulfotelmatobacter sp.]